jgi:hypothetical protein
MDFIRKWYIKAFQTDEATWAGHGVQGLLFTLALGWISMTFAAGFVVGAFLHREIDNVIYHIQEKDRNVRDWLVDGWMDMISPLMGMVVGALILMLLGWF